MVRNTLGVGVPSAGLNTEITDLADAPQYTKEELNMDILSDGSRARRLGLEYERGYKLTNSSIDEASSGSGQVTSIRTACNAFEWLNYDSDGNSIVVMQVGGKIHFFNGINSGHALSDDESDYNIDLAEYALQGDKIFGLAVTTASTSVVTGYSKTDDIEVGTKIYSDRALEVEIGTVESIEDDTYTLDNEYTAELDEDRDSYYLSNDYKHEPVTFTSGYGKLFISSKYIDVIMVEYNKEYTYTQSTSATVTLAVSNNTGGRSSFCWRSQTRLLIKDTDGNVVFDYYPYSGSYKFTGTANMSTVMLCDDIQTRLNNLGLGFSITGNGTDVFYVSTPAGGQYNGYSVTLQADYVSHGGSHYRNCYSSQSYYTYNDGYITVTGTTSGASDTGVTVPEGLHHQRITPMVRDTQGVQRMYDSDGNLIVEIDNDAQPTELTDIHKYNLLNQGWDNTKIESFFSTNHYYPSNALTWYVLKDANGAYAPAQVTNHAFGTSLAPRGKFILNAYEMDRDRASNIASIPDSAFAKDRPEDITFYAGRLWYALGSRLLYSQIITEDASLVDRCYQSADPTSEDVSDPVDTDGGVINVHQCGKVLRICSLGNAIIAFGNKGVMAILPGNNIGFTPTSYYQQLVSSVGIIAKHSVVSVGDAVFYWSPLGIYRVVFNENGQLVAENISYATIHSFYKNLGEVSIKNCIAKLNSIKNEISFMYPTNADSPRQLNAVLKYNITDNTWTPREIPLTELASPFIIGGIELRNSVNTAPKAIVEASGDTVVINGREAVEITKVDTDYIGYDTLSYLVVDGVSRQLTFANCTNIEHKDWTIGDVLGNGYSYNSYIVTHPLVFSDIYTSKQAPYITTTYKRSEEGNLFKSGCFMSARWDWAFSSSAYKWDIKQQTYRLPSDQVYRLDEFDEFKEFVNTKTRVRGSGKSLQLKFENDGDKDFRLCAIGIDARGYKK